MLAGLVATQLPMGPHTTGTAHTVGLISVGLEYVVPTPGIEASWNQVPWLDSSDTERGGVLGERLWQAGAQTVLPGLQVHLASVWALWVATAWTARLRHRVVRNLHRATQQNTSHGACSLGHPQQTSPESPESLPGMVSGSVKGREREKHILRDAQTGDRKMQRLVMQPDPEEGKSQPQRDGVVALWRVPSERAEVVGGPGQRNKDPAIQKHHTAALKPEPPPPPCPSDPAAGNSPTTLLPGSPFTTAQRGDAPTASQ